MTHKPLLDISDATRLVVQLASEKQASDISLLDMRQACSFTDYFVLATTESSRQMNSLVDDIAKALNAVGISVHHLEGNKGGGWTLMDYGDFIVHVFRQEERDFYQMDEFWSKAPLILRIQ